MMYSVSMEWNFIQVFKLSLYQLNRCRGTTKWVHQACIERWVDEKQKGHISADVQCPQCGTTLVIKFPKPNFVVAVLDTVDRFIQKLCPVRIWCIMIIIPLETLLPTPNSVM